MNFRFKTTQEGVEVSVWSKVTVDAQHQKPDEYSTMLVIEDVETLKFRHEVEVTPEIAEQIGAALIHVSAGRFYTQSGTKAAA